ncbi:hypothetical protein [Pleomorphovibrio marinus]|uniref:hypothetical protein n=1 Tax=Pleomorphovibrio marinus TaxID=2164132 RepID=UPI000E0AC830|nr:hypothetical protein [Pleomorphovibrio marinus]
MVFKENQHFRNTWVMYLILMIELPTLVLMTVLWLTGNFGEDGYIPFLIVVGIILGAFWFIMSIELETRIDRFGLSYRCFPITGWRKYPKEKITNIEVLNKGMMWKFGGLGIRYNFKKWAYVFSNEAAIQVESAGKKFVLSTRKPGEARSIIDEWKLK